MRDQRKRSTRENYKENIHQEILEPHYPSWDMEELDLTARYKKVEHYFFDSEMKQPHQTLNINPYKLNRNE